jgi:outer membrane immunogenic protein
MAAPALEKPANWTGFYAGARVGYIWEDPELVASAISSLSGFPTTVTPGGVITNSAISPPGSINDESGHRFVGGGQVGFDLQMGPFVFGLATDISYGRRRIGTNATANTLATSDTPTISVTSTAEVEVDWYSTVRGRLGIARDKWMVYVTGGYAYGKLQVSNAGNFVINGATTPTLGVASSITNSVTKSGSALGAGAAYAFSDHVSLFAEWTRIDLGASSAVTSQVTPFPGSPAGLVFSPSARSDVTVKFDVIQVGVNVKLFP